MLQLIHDEVFTYKGSINFDNSNRRISKISLFNQSVSQTEDFYNAAYSNTESGTEQLNVIWFFTEILTIITGGNYVSVKVLSKKLTCA